ncbi:ribonuclease H-like domain-containing protein [Suillus clintonianus]|uniref:ribonuclease H-like domain-containing protein n=1 Tax=Suillus clintonianus TaxID=1904413 RepID=UPI001B877E85|nr:ribonuclease H-like domain-containing protein [Suillus clintonianus]KAG2131815.1 ribonuclease H-like domain-containing protein [Suillus clintonianus]
MASTNTVAGPSTSMILPNTFSDYATSVQSAALATTGLAATTLPQDIEFHRSIHVSFAAELDSLSTRVLRLTNRLVRLAGTVGSGTTGRGTLDDEEDVLDGFKSLIVDPVDRLLERTDMCLDDYLGRKKEPAIAVPALPNQSNNSSKKTPAQRGRLDPALQHASHLPKPQLLFNTKVDNHNDSPYIPARTLEHKWCARVPLGYIFHDQDESGSMDEEEKQKLSAHPYYYELTHPAFPTHLFHPTPITILPASLTGTDVSKHTYVSTPSALSAMATKLKAAKEIAVDLEHHSYRTYRGFLCLMQISTREEDFIIDLLVPSVRDSISNALGEIFADPEIVKVFHGAESDIVWLQQDFNVFVVGLFDTYHASKALDFQKHGLANLLEAFCDFIPDKRYQLADWRIRPLPEEMLTYARSDTHFLLYIYDRLRLSLIERAQTMTAPEASLSTTISTIIKGSISDKPAHVLLNDVLARSTRTALRLYDREAYDAELGVGTGGWDTLARKWNKSALANSASEINGVRGGVTGEVYRALHRWRENIAREEDESTRYVLPNHQLFTVAERSPSNAAQLLALFSHASVPPVLRRRAGELAEVIKSTVERVTSSGVVVEAPMVTTDVKIVNSAVSNEVVDEVTANSRLWGSVKVSSPSVVQRASSSSLFGPRTAAADEGSSYSASRSSLFGSSLTSHTTPQSSAPIISANRKKFHDLVTRIHRTLVIAPNQPQIIKVGSQTIFQSSTSSGSITTQPATPVSTLASAEAPDETTILGQVEIPFIPPDQRHRLAPVSDDTIVVVGQARQKKRKRIKSTVLGKPQTGDQDDTGEDEAFDYATVPNLLDDVPPAPEELDTRKKKKQKAKGTGVVEYGNFRAPPRDMREVKSGNKTHTFR